MKMIAAFNEEGFKVPVQLWTPLQEVEPQALDQLKNVASLPWAFHHVAVMADVHYGKGCTVGSVIAMKDAVAPAAVGVDIGCGMAAMRTNLLVGKIDRKLSKLRSAIEIAIPVGFQFHQEPVTEFLKVLDPELCQRIRAHMALFPELSLEIRHYLNRAWCQIGTLGGGNHFIELCLDSGKCDCENGSVWGGIGYNKCEDCGGKGVRDPQVYLMLHSGSRNIGKELAEIHISAAKKLAHNQDLPDLDLAVFLAGTKEMAAYRKDLFWAQEYALLNREAMLALYQNVLRYFWPGAEFDPPVMCHHNYVSEEVHFGENVLVTRKGAIRAGKGEYGIIPGSMGTKSYIVRGLGNPESFESASHGAGRRMSRNAARKRYTKKDLAEQTRGVECRKDKDVIDEIPGAYKNIDKVMENQRDLVEVVAELKGILCVKG